ncbi:transglutaminase domain-containing protein [Marinilabilia rubra]|uniref:Transglutaminase-like domain-containing protein n=1 Tax=Marinilabilia rubra TaxID=2162893 RepID=A0A2U2B491_9BACT|nr:transglutaminase domain-containing protein [Marinilabilia rubra]PWD97878.1 hypothetical protein DDZ16_18635 [Marinilabilia rubra]
MLNKLLLSVFFTGVLFSCTNSGVLIEDANMQEDVRQSLQRQKELAVHRSDQLFSLYDSNISKAEKEALDFLYAYMPLSDLSNHSGTFYLLHARYALKARNTFPWGAKIPNDIFLHYVLPHRVNNEYLDTARVVFYKELKERLQGLNMKQAALEVNHWCQEKVIYHSTNEYRTSSPLNTVKTAYGRCGEQSTFTVAAMRAAGIPARQIYTPRWPHTNDNHAWVEVWVDGNWYFMGACEPEPELNMGWFESPATRAMLTHHRTYGHIKTYDEVVATNPFYTEVNTLTRYARTKKIRVKVKDGGGSPVEGAEVSFQLPNFAEFYDIATVQTNSDGVCEFLTGLGDLMVWVNAEGQYAWKKLAVPNTDTLEIVLREKPEAGMVINHLIHAPAPSATADHSKVDRKGHSERLQYGDSLRTAYENTFIDSTASVDFANRLNLDPVKVFSLFEASRGNWPVVRRFLEYAGGANLEKAMMLLDVIAMKDRRDTPLKVLIDHLDYSANPLKYPDEIYQKYVFNPRIHNELLSAYKKDFQQFFEPAFIQKCQVSPVLLAKWVNENIQLNEKANPWGVPQLPVGVLELRVADRNSLNIFLVAVARSMGIASRVDKVRKQSQVLIEGEWIDIDPVNGKIGNRPKGNILINLAGNTPSGNVPKYYKDFTLNKFEGGGYETLDYASSKVFESFPASLGLDEGSYSLVTVKRLPDGSSKTRRVFFDVQQGKTEEVSLVIPDKGNIKAFEGDLTIDLNRTFEEYSSKEGISLNQLAGENGLVLIWIDPAREPSRHLVNDLTRLGSSFDKWPGSIALLLKPEKITPAFSIDQYDGLPNRSVFLIDESEWLLDIERELGIIMEEEMPAVLVVSASGNLVFQSSGYRIGIGDDVLNQVAVSCSIH